MKPSSVRFSSFLRRTAAVSAVAALGVAGLAGCSDGGSGGSSGGGQSGSSSADDGKGVDGQGTEPLTIAKPDGAITTESNNPYFGDSSASKYSYANVIYERLGLVNLTGDLETTPWLAETIEWNDDYTQVTVKARSGVTWSDGEEFTAEDIAFSFGMLLDGTLTDSSGVGVKSIDVDGDKVTLTFENSMFTRQSNVMSFAIVPEHIWKDIEDPNTAALADPAQAVGTGPYVLTNWSTESVTLTARDDWWGGELAVPTLNYISYGDNAALATALASGQADWAQAFIPQLQENFLDVDPDNRFWAAPSSGETMLVMNLTKKPFDNPAFREALGYAIDRDSWIEIAREGADTAIWSKTGLSDLLGKDILPEFKDENFTFDKDKAREILTDAGYTWDAKDNLLDPDGTAVTFRFSAPAGWSDWNTYQQLFANEMKDVLGIEVKIDTPDWGGWDEARNEGTFDLILHWTEGTGNAYGPYTSAMDPRWINDDGKAAYDFGRYDEPEVTAALNTYASASSDDEREAALKVIQTAFVKDVPVIFIGTGSFLGEYNVRNYVGFPSADDPYAPADPLQTTVVQILQRLKVKG